MQYRTSWDAGLYWIGYRNKWNTQDYMEYRTTWNTGLHGIQDYMGNRVTHVIQDFMGWRTILDRIQE